jgi:hypothetical protein
MFWDEEGDRGLISDVSGYLYFHQTVLAEQKGTGAPCNSQKIKRAFATGE